MNYLRAWVSILFCLAGSSFLPAQDGLDTISFHEVFSETYQEFTKDHSVWVTQFRKGWRYSDSLNPDMGRVEMDSIYLQDEKVIATAVILYYKKDTLRDLTFYLSITEDEKFLRAIGKGVFARLGGQGKRRNFKSGGERFYYRRNMISWTYDKPVEWGYGVGRGRSS